MMTFFFNVDKGEQGDEVEKEIVGKTDPVDMRQTPPMSEGQTTPPLTLPRYDPLSLESGKSSPENIRLQISFGQP